MFLKFYTLESFSIKLSTSSIKKIQKEHRKDRLFSHRKSDQKTRTTYIILKLKEYLEDNDVMVEEIPGFADFIQGLLPITTIFHKENIQKIPGNTLEEIVKR